MRNAVAQQSCRHLTPLLSTAGENTIHFRLLFLLPLPFRNRGMKLRQTLQCHLYVHLPRFTLALGVRAGIKCSTRGLSRTNVDLRNDSPSLWPSERVPSWTWMNVALACSLSGLQWFGDTAVLERLKAHTWIAALTRLSILTAAVRDLFGLISASVSAGTCLSVNGR